MINLLPEPAIKEVKRHYRLRLTQLSLFMFAGIVVVSIIFLLPSLFAIQSKLSLTQDNLLAAKARPVSKQAQTVEETVQNINKKVKLLNSIERSTGFLEVVQKLLAYKKNNISFSHIELENGRVVLRGKASTRSALLDLLGQIEAEPFFVDVASPISGLIATSSLEFSIDMNLAKP